jgi:biotin transporter BioY
MFCNKPNTEMTNEEYKLGIKISVIAVLLYALLVFVCHPVFATLMHKILTLV